jgi:A/G-specific adenine glycosylase
MAFNKDRINPQDLSAVRRQLKAWYRKNRRDLPWRRTADPYLIWVSEVMLQQTQVDTVIPYYQRFMCRFPTLGSLAEAELQDVLKLWEGLGYYARARNLHRAAKAVVEKYSGAVPKQWAEFKALPGVGDYIASAVLSIAFQKPLPVVDGNVKRVLSRLFEIDAPVNSSSSFRLFKSMAGRLLDSKDPGTFNQALMELGALVCKPKNPDCEACPLAGRCRALQAQAVDAYPKRSSRRAVPQYHIAVGVIFKDRRVLIVRRPDHGLLGGLWEFPSGRVQPHESPESACMRTIFETVNLKVEVISHLTRIHHAYTHFKIVADIFICRYESGRVKRAGPAAHRWVGVKALDRYPLHKANHKFMAMLLAAG